MATTYIVLQEGGTGAGNTVYVEVGRVENATNAEQARRKVAEGMREDDEALETGVTLIAIPIRNWRTGRGTLKAETQRRIRSA